MNPKIQIPLSILEEKYCEDGQFADKFVKEIGTNIKRKMDKYLPSRRKDGTAETTLNVTVGSGQTITSTELKIAAGADAALGNPDIKRSLAVCFNTTTYASFDEIRPAVYDSTITAPGFLSTRNIIGGKCYVLSTEAIADYAEYRFYIVIDPISTFNPATENAYAFLIDKTFYKDDKDNWVEGWGDESDLVADADIGMATFGNEKAIFMN